MTLSSMGQTRASGTKTQSPTLFVGNINPPNWLWSALHAVGQATEVRNAVLIVFSEDKRGRLGIFCNRYISGGVIDGSGKTGIEAVQELLSVKSGIFGFRACLASEGAELKQNLALDISEMLESVGESGGRHTTPSDAVGKLYAAQTESRMMEIHQSEGELGDQLVQLGAEDLVGVPVPGRELTQSQAAVPEGAVAGTDAPAADAGAGQV